MRPAGPYDGWPGYPAYGWYGYRWQGYWRYGAWPCYSPGLCRFLWRDEARRAREEALRHELPASPFDPAARTDPWGDGGIWGYARRIPPPTAEEEIRPEYRGAHGVLVGDLELRVAERRDRVRAERLDQITAELPRRPDDDDPGQNTLPIRRRVCSISWSSVIHPML